MRKPLGYAVKTGEDKSDPTWGEKLVLHIHIKFPL